MKKTVRTIMAVVALSAAMAGCQKETVEVLTPSNIDVVDANTTKRTVVYTVNGEEGRMVIEGDEAWIAFLQRMVDLAENGYRVTFGDAAITRQANSAKEVVTYTTPDKDKAVAWADTMMSNGYTVSVYYDNVNNVFVCIAER